jgi:hypothetical protein
MPPLTSVNRDRTLTIPAGAPAGNYSLNGYFGVYSPPTHTIYAESHFTFNKTADGDGEPVLEEWFVDTGEPFITEAGWDGVPVEYSLYHNFPNPFNPVTTISFGLPEAGLVKLAVYDLQGREVAVLVDNHCHAGIQEVTFDASNFASGVYLYRLEAGDFHASGKMVLMK